MQRFTISPLLGQSTGRLSLLLLFLFIVNVTACDDSATQPGVDDSYAAVVLADGPVGYWRLGEVTGRDAIDSSGNGLTGSYVGDPVLGVTGLIKGQTTAVQFSADTDDGVEIPHHDALLLEVYSVEAWVKPFTLPSVEGAAIAGKSYSYHLWVEPDGSFGFGQIDGNRVSAARAEIGVTYHLVGTHDGETLRLYVNGALSASGPSATQRLSDWPFHIGRGASPGGRFDVDGVVDEVAVYDWALPAARVREHYEAGLQ
jgi:hypothetical protein